MYIRRPLPLPLQGEAPETAKHQHRPVLLHWQAVQELTAPRPAAVRRHDLSRNTMLFRCGKTRVFDPFGWPLNLVFKRFKRGKSATTWRPFEQPSVLHCHAVKAWQRVLFRRRGLPRSAMPFRHGKTHVFEPFGWPLKPVLLAPQSQQMGHDLAAFRAAFHPSLPCC